MNNSDEKQNLLISVISPVYGCEACLHELCNRLFTSLEKITFDFEILLVDDASPDQSWELIKRLSSLDSRVKGIQLSRNFGQHYAIAAGLQHATGKWVVVMDCDLQDKPEEISRLYAKAQEGFDVVMGKRAERKDLILKRMFSRLFYKLLSYLTNTKHDRRIANFGIFHHKVIQAVLSMHDTIRHFPSMVQWVGFNRTSIDVEHSSRKHGKTSYTFKKLLHLSMDVILGFSTKPLRLMVKFGIYISLFAFLFALYNLYQYFSGGVDISGWTSLVISIWLLSGVIIFLIGTVGLYIGKILDGVKDRPKFIVSKTINLGRVQED